MRRPAVSSRGLVVVTAVLFGVVAGAPRLQAGETAAVAPAAPVGRVVVAAADFKLTEYAGRVVLLDFWASWCKPCKQSMPWLSMLQRKHAGEGLQIVAVSVDTEERAMLARLGEIDPGIVVVFDPQGVLVAQYDPEGMPTSFLIDRTGKVQASHLGFFAAETAAREAEVVALLAADKQTESP
jgi:thiol-disulfide isomerase/thioredoxin